MSTAGQTEVVAAKRSFYKEPFAVLVSLAVLVLALFLFTTFASHAYRRMQEAERPVVV